MVGQFQVSLCPLAVNRGLCACKNEKTARCGWLCGRDGGFFIINARKGFDSSALRYFNTAFSPICMLSAHPPSSFRCDHSA
ncbi:hypothetical protein T4B_1275 [Trichinella pseudospiralis]|uniref:Uncharacterized protein n=1 Tax=Trichinella pseudospiralis TaxID=6337 RepID=A0A0V1J8P3_TRIPS|nr:hypothetical protein T4A_6564 [Trichinella pseudospiralis]KRZ30965.1 hypothetical protein T4B_1275 [Trichinella pseudospiralis]KRZ40118.1 hypothetical protein T4C_3916 [Trichinella pseudospiralis]